MISTNHLGKSKIYAALGIAISILSGCGAGSGGSSSKNDLDIGYGTKAPDSISIDLFGLMNYNGKTREELFSLRSKQVNTHPELIKSPYAPTPECFAIEQKNPWWSMKGYICRSHELNNTDGPSRESAYFGNPFLLVCPEFYGSNMNTAPGRFPKYEDFANVVPTYWPPKSVKFFPKEKREEITYDLMAYYNSLKSLLDGPWPISQIGFDLCTYNARDFGYNYMYIQPGTSTNLSKYPSEIITLSQGIGTRTKDSCAPACNDVVDTPEALTGFKIKNLPAKCHLLFWKQQPQSYLVPSDLTVDLVFN